MERAVEIRTRVRHHVDASNIKLCALRVEFERCLEGEVIAKQRRRQPAVENHAMLDDVSEVDETHDGYSRRCLIQT